MSRPLTDAELDFLTPEERAALRAEEEGADSAPEDTDAPEPTDPAMDAPDEDVDGAEVPDEEAPSAPARPSPATPSRTKADVRPPEALAPPTQAPADAYARLDALHIRKAEMIQRFEDGEMTARQFTAVLAMLDQEAETLRLSQFKDRLMRELADQQREQAWRADVAAFVAAHPDVRRNEVLWHAFDLVVRQVTADAADSGESNQDQLARAYQLWSEHLGLTPSRAAEKVARTERRIPPTLAKAPAARMADTDENRWSALDRLATLDPDAYEQRLARMSAAELKDYERLS